MNNLDVLNAGKCGRIVAGVGMEKFYPTDEDGIVLSQKRSIYLSLMCPYPDTDIDPSNCQHEYISVGSNSCKCKKCGNTHWPPAYS